MLNRRDFARFGLASIAFTALARAQAPTSDSTATDTGYRNEVPGYGDLRSDPAAILDLPAGFSYDIVSQAGEAMSDGFVTPDSFDGMACFPLSRHRVAMVRNHELLPSDREHGPAGGLPRLEERLRNQPFFGADSEGRPLPGGTTTIVYDLRRRRRDLVHLSLTGTAINCAGGPTPWGSWLTCEESTVGSPDVARSHGWVFEIPANSRRVTRPVPLTAMGRFRHEAAAVDPATGIVYLTEDRENGLFYRLLPERPGRLARGGRLQALALDDSALDTRNWQGTQFPPGSAKTVRWIDLDEVESPQDDLRLRGHAAGAAIFARGEGIHRGSGDFYFTCTSGGAARIGQVMRYVPSPAEGRSDESQRPASLQLFLESRDSMVMDYADNIAVSPWGHLILCEDRRGNAVNYLRGVTPRGQVYAIARLRVDTELAGACFSPDGSVMFVNVYRPGKTLAIRGPWASVRLA